MIMTIAIAIANFAITIDTSVHDIIAINIDMDMAIGGDDNDDDDDDNPHHELNDEVVTAT